MGKRTHGFIAAGLAVLIATSMNGAGQASSTERNREVIQHYFDLMNQGDWKHVAELFAPDVQHHLGNWQGGAETIVRGRQLLTDNLEDIYRTFPDWKMEPLEIVVEGDSVVARCRVSGTHRGVQQRQVNGGFLVGVPPTGKHFVVQHIHWFKVRNGQIAEHATSRDDLGMTQQLGLLLPRR